MNKRGKATALLLVLLVLISLSLAAGSYYLLMQEKSKSLSLQNELESVKTKQKSAQDELDNSKKKLSDLESKLNDSQDQIEKLNDSIGQEKSAKEDAFAKLDELKLALVSQEKQVSDLSGQITAAGNETKKLKLAIKDLESKKTELETKIKEMQAAQAPVVGDQDIELGTIVVNPENATPPTSQETKTSEEKSVIASGLEGKILTVNREYDFVVMNLGSKDGVKIGNTFLVYDENNKYLGDVKIEKLHDSMSAASFVLDAKSKDLKNKVNEGNKVVRKAK
jgi:DNA repair exonuclease SbcCD ATPase subunit